MTSHIISGPILAASLDNDDVRFMKQALQVATEFGADPALSPIGCVIVLHNEIIAAERNLVVQKRDATAHAEMQAIRSAGKAFEMGELRNAVLYSTLQPCGMCTMASIWSKVGRIVFGAGRDDVHKMYFESRHVDTLEFVTHAYRKDLIVLGGVLREECAKLYWRQWDDVPIAQQGNL